MNPKAQNARRAFGRSVDDWQWAWWSEVMVLQGRGNGAAVEIQGHKSGIWFWRVAAGPYRKCKSLSDAVDDALRELNLPWPVHEDLRMIAAAEYERLLTLREEFNKLKARGSHANVGD